MCKCLPKLNDYRQKKTNKTVMGKLRNRGMTENIFNFGISRMLMKCIDIVGVYFLHQRECVMTICYKMTRVSAERSEEKLDPLGELYQICFSIFIIMPYKNRGF